MNLILDHLVNLLSTFRWVKKKCFQYHPSSEANMKADWEKCIQSIDGKNRSIKRKQSYIKQ